LLNQGSAKEVTDAFVLQRDAWEADMERAYDDMYTPRDGGSPSRLWTPGVQGSREQYGTQQLQAKYAHLNEAQVRVVSQALLFAWDLSQHEANPSAFHTPEPLSLMIYGPGGTGKSTAIDCIVKELGMSKVFLVAPTGTAANNIGGRTIHSSASIPIGVKSDGSCDPIHRDNQVKLRARLEPAMLMIVDELSMVDAGLFKALQTRLRDVRLNSGRTAWDRLGKILIVDWFQLDPVSGQSLLRCMMQATVWDTFRAIQDEATPPPAMFTPSRGGKGLRAPKATILEVGRELMGFTRVAFTQLMRSGNDANMKFIQDTMRDLSQPGPVTRELIDLLKERVLPANETSRETGWKSCTMVFTNETRHKFNEVFVRDWAMRNGARLFRWNNKLANVHSEDDGSLYRLLPETLTRLAAIGMPVVLNQNVKGSVHIGVVNGAQATLRDFVFTSDRDRAAFRDAQDSGPDNDTGEIHIPRPDCVIVGIRRCDLVGAKLLNRELDESELLVPIGLRSRSTKYMGFTITYGELAFDSAFVMTDYRLQSKTLAHLTLELTREPRKPGKGITSQALYVGLTRVRSFEGLHVLPNNYGAPLDMDHLLELKHDKYLVAWDKSYSANGVFDPNLAYRTCEEVWGRSA